MSLPNVIGAYADCFDYFAKAQDSPRGIRLLFPDLGAARFFAMRMNQARVLQRDESRRIYPKDDPLWNRSEFDMIQVRAPIPSAEGDGHYWVYVQSHNASVAAVEEITE